MIIAVIPSKVSVNYVEEKNNTIYIFCKQEKSDMILTLSHEISHLFLKKRFFKNEVINTLAIETMAWVTAKKICLDKYWNEKIAIEKLKTYFDFYSYQKNIFLKLFLRFLFLVSKFKIRGANKTEKAKTKSLLAGTKNFSAMAREKFLIGV